MFGLKTQQCVEKTVFTH